MDYRSTLNTTDAPVEADYAIFTSIRTPMGQGYHVVATSKGVTSAEKAEVQQRSPSHGALCSQADDSVGLSAYTLSTGRYVIAFSRYGKTEYTARGGRVIDTHIAILDPQEYSKFSNNPLRVQQALLNVIGHDPVTKPPRVLEQLGLSPAATSPLESVTNPPVFNTNDDAARIVNIAKAITDNKPFVVFNAEPALSTLEWALAILPVSWRQNIAMSTGIKYALSRKLQWAIVDAKIHEVQRITHGHNILLLDTQAEPNAQPSQLDTWFSYIKELWQRQQFNNICWLTSQMTDTLDADNLTRIAGVGRDFHRAQSANDATKNELFARYSTWDARHTIENKLAQQIAQLTEPPPEEEPADAKTPPSLATKR